MIFHLIGRFHEIVENRYEILPFLEYTTVPGLTFFFISIAVCCQIGVITRETVGPRIHLDFPRGGIIIMTALTILMIIGMNINEGTAILVWALISFHYTAEIVMDLQWIYYYITRNSIVGVTIWLEWISVVAYLLVRVTMTIDTIVVFIAQINIAPSDD